ncbi:MAG: hypothetical protein ACJ716_11780 [Marmoricola sp.]
MAAPQAPQAPDPRDARDRTTWSGFLAESGVAFGLGTAAGLVWHFVVGSGWGAVVGIALVAGTVGTGVALRSTLSARRFFSPSRLVDAYAEADRIGGGGRNPKVLRDALVAASIPGAFDDPDTGRLAYVYDAWRDGAAPAELAALVPDRLLD